MHSRSRRVARPALAAVTATVAAVALALTGCAGQGSGGSNANTDQNGKITLSFWNGNTGPDGPAMQKVVDAFNASQSKVVVKNVTMPWDTLYQKLLTGATSKGGPDIVALDFSRVPAYASQGLFQPIDDYYAGGAHDTAKLPKTAIDASKYDGKNYGVPVDIATTMMYYNKALFTKAGLDPNKPPTTWDEFAAMVPKLTTTPAGAAKPDQYAIALADHETVDMYPPFLWNAGGDIVSSDNKKSELDSPASLTALNFWVDLVKNKQASPIGLSGADADKLFATGKAAIEINGPWATTGYKQAGIDFGVVRPFAGPSGNAILADVETMALPAKDDKATKEAAYQFMHYWTLEKSQKTWSEGSGFAPLEPEVGAQITDNPYPAIFGAKDVVDDSRILLPGLQSGSSIVQDIFYPSLQKALNGQGSVDEVFKAASQQVQAKLDQK
ncbi:ABC transporter substrate-binding protein [Leifsonia sp. TF02-11]|uniref:ABC transporter substrate-binding protein n=1 Tax=Leifsonia sp. TF02-11 TaxID=2815212 RepID=UPI001AA11575|nr:ABC transporter substrate-binding protein [Leifsonia sp. TF02-11]MBN9630785.1 ABC transporter substrate-binding protein [Actinomycetota bacterium]MBO1740685.1 ABC transporter substrate-binding protein [Leifsonia sp. TF02-11]